MYFEIPIAWVVGLRSGWYVGNALLSMYCKCGNIDEANAIFEEICDKDTVLWNTIIAGYTRAAWLCPRGS